jgi:hypothetical protein
MDSFVRNVSDFPPTDRSALENVLGVRLSDDQQVTIYVTPAVKPPGNSPSGIPAWLDVYQGLSDEEADDLHASITRANLTRQTD